MTVTRIVESRFFFCHLQKTAGMSLIRRLQRHFGERGVYPSHEDGPMTEAVISIPQLLARWQVRSHEVHVVAGHFPLCTQSLLGGGFLTLTVLREPVARTLSYLRHHRRMSPADRSKSLEQIYDDTFRFRGLIHNHMVKMLSLTVEEMRGGALTQVSFTTQRLELAMAQLASIDVVGIQEDFDEFCDTLSERFGFQLGASVFVNRTGPDEEVAQSFRERVARDNALDAELYACACRIVAARRRDHDKPSSVISAASR